MSHDDESRRVVELSLPVGQRRLRPLDFPDLIRLGRDHDGGYIVPRSVIESADSILALGVFDDWSFEMAAQETNPSLRVDAYDHTISRKRFVREFWIDVVRALKGRIGMAQVRRRSSTVRAYDAFFCGNNRHFAEQITNEPLRQGECSVSLALDRLGGERVFVKMDIEGSEYRVIHELVSHESRIVGACIEFHDVGPLRLVFDSAVKALLNHYVIAHVHANNYGKIAADGLPDVLEITIVNRRRAKEVPHREKTYLEDLDQPNDASRPDLAIVR